MKVSEVTLDVIKQYGVIELDEDDDLIESVFMPAAKGYIADYTGMTQEQMDEHDSVAIAYIALCAFLYDNRSMNIINDKENAVVQSILSMHCKNLI